VLEVFPITKYLFVNEVNLVSSCARKGDATQPWVPTKCHGLALGVGGHNRQKQDGPKVTDPIRADPEVLLSDGEIIDSTSDASDKGLAAHSCLKSLISAQRNQLE
jgi:hypothetical protein